MIIIWIIVAILMFSAIIVVHELGHFWAARRFGVKVEEFWIWIPPKARELFTDKKGTVFTLNWLPIGWFVRLKWENPQLLKNKNDPEALINKTYFQQSVILLGWVCMNFLLAIVIFSTLFFIWVKPIWVNDQIATSLELKIIPTYEQAINSWMLTKNPWVILQPIPRSLAEKGWIEVWDILLQINWKDIETPEQMVNIIWDSLNTVLTFEILQWDEKKSIPIRIWSDGKIGAYVWENITLNEDFEYKYWLLESIKYWTLETVNQSLLTVKAIGSLFRKIAVPETPQERTEALSEMKWPIWIVDLVAHSLSAWIVFIVIIGAIISINLWVFNLLPIPALDWWRFLFISINTAIKNIFWKKAINENTENIIHAWFFLTLIALSLIIWYNDIIHIFNR